VGFEAIPQIWLGETRCIICGDRDERMDNVFYYYTRDPRNRTHPSARIVFD
jgi:hypothetical protein